MFCCYKFYRISCRLSDRQNWYWYSLTFILKISQDSRGGLIFLYIFICLVYNTHQGVRAAW
ncbi:unnamed protein product [Meloidogyne enterolobii]|uniref:Uncharacterized protein n=1 Tax=Meloidogyne enterolobii TaxID=390850 RepID=A0ACB0XWY9_MELEN